MGGQDQISVISNFLLDEMDFTKGKIGYETGMSTYTPEGNLSHYEYLRLQEALPGAEFINAHEIVDKLALIKDQGTINRFTEASRQVDCGHKVALEAISHGSYKGMTETELAGIAALGMRRAGSVSEWNFAGLNELSSGWRTGLGACTPPSTKELKAGEVLMVDLHSLFKVTMGDHSHNYLIGPATKRQHWHADNFVALVDFTLKNYRAGATPAQLVEDMLAVAEKRGCADFINPGVEHGIGVFGDEWRIGGENDGPIPYWTNPDHVYQPNEMVICAMQYICPPEDIGFRYENPIVIHKDGCEYLSKFPLGIEEI
jgi:Xaa-Pro aminopeptidase